MKSMRQKRTTRGVKHSETVNDDDKNAGDCDFSIRAECEDTKKNSRVFCSNCHSNFNSSEILNDHLLHKICGKSKKVTKKEKDLFDPHDSDELRVSWRSNSFLSRFDISHPLHEEPVSIDDWIRRNLSINYPFSPLYLKVIYEGSNNSNLSVQEVKLPPFNGKFIFNPDKEPETYINVGGKVWSVDTLNIDQNKLYIAVGSDCPSPANEAGQQNKYGVPGNVLGLKCSRANLVTIWEMENIQDQRRHVQLLYAIPHHGGRVFSVSWAPDRKIQSNAVEQYDAYIGLLAVACADGILRVYLCPSISNIQGVYGTVLPLSPLFVASLGDSLVTCSAWNPREPSILLTGHSNGCCSLWRIDENHRNVAVTPIALSSWMCFTSLNKMIADNNGHDSIRTVSWNPYQKFLFASCGYNEQLCVWDTRDPYSGRSLIPPSKARTGTGIAWDPFMSGIFFSQMDSPYLNFFHFTRCIAPLWRSMSQPLFVPKHASWSATICSHNKFAIVAATTPDAEVALMAYSSTRYASKLTKQKMQRVQKKSKYDSSQPSMFPVRFEFELSTPTDPNDGVQHTCYVREHLHDYSHEFPAQYTKRPSVTSLIHSVELITWKNSIGSCWMICGGFSGLLRIAAIDRVIKEAEKVAI